MRQYTFIVGSTAERDTTPDDVLMALESHVTGATAQWARGLWQGQIETSVVVTIGLEDEHEAPKIAAHLARAFKQHTVYVSDGCGKAWLEP
jgi:hypothetical protein